MVVRMADPTLAIDIGGAKLTAGIVDDEGTVLIRDRVPTPARDVWPELARLVKRVVAASPEPPVMAGVGCSGPVRASEGLVSPLAIPSWRGFPLRDHVQELTGLPTVVDTDAKAFVSGEVWKGAAQGVADVIGVVVATSVSGGIISGGRLLHGRLGNAGGIGHLVVEPEGRPCVCGGHGCLEAYCSRLSIEEETGRAAQRAPRGSAALGMPTTFRVVGVLMGCPWVCGGQIALRSARRAAASSWRAISGSLPTCCVAMRRNSAAARRWPWRSMAAHRRCQKRVAAAAGATGPNVPSR